MEDMHGPSFQEGLDDTRGSQSILHRVSTELFETASVPMPKEVAAMFNEEIEGRIPVAAQEDTVPITRRGENIEASPSVISPTMVGFNSSTLLDGLAMDPAGSNPLEASLEALLDHILVPCTPPGMGLFSPLTEANAGEA